MMRSYIVAVLSLALATASGQPYDFTRQRLFPGFDGRFCKVQPSVASDGRGTALLGYQKLLLTGSDVLYGQFVCRSEDGGLTWGDPVDQKDFTYGTDGDGHRISRYATLHYSARNGRWFALGQELLYGKGNTPLRSNNGKRVGTAIFVSVDPERGLFTGYTEIPCPFDYVNCLPFGQCLDCDNGDILVSFYYSEASAPRLFRSMCARYAFDGDSLRLVAHGEPIRHPDASRSVCEPSVTRFGGKHYITLRSEMGAMVAVSDDGLHYGEPVPWTWEDGTPVGSVNTQQHWIRGEDAPYLAYTRVTPWNDHVFRNRAPIFMARFDPGRMCLVRETEFALTPELGTRSGNFNTEDVGDESWLVTAEWMQGPGGKLGLCERYGADNSIWLVKVRFAGKVGGRRNLLFAGEPPPKPVVDLLPKVASALGCELSVGLASGTAAPFEPPELGRWDFVALRGPLADGAAVCTRLAAALPKAEIVLSEPVVVEGCRAVRDLSMSKSLRVAPVGSALRHLGEGGAEAKDYLEALVWVGKLFGKKTPGSPYDAGVDVADCPYAPAALSADEAKRVRAAAQAAVDGVPVPVGKGGVAIPEDVAAGLRRIRASGNLRCEIREADYSPESGVRVSLLLKPTDASSIRCEVRLPDPRTWDGRFWGFGTDGWPGMEADYALGPSTSAEMKNDLGTLRFPIGKVPVHPDVRKDFGWRATHLATVEGKRLVKLFYGRDPDRSYFFGAFSGGRSALVEARRFPEDYDGIVAVAPALDPVAQVLPDWRRAQLGKKYGAWFTPEQAETVRQAELAYFAKNDPEAARGAFIDDPRPTKEMLDGCWREALRRDPSLAGLENAWRELFEPIRACGRRLAPGFVIGTEFAGDGGGFLLDSLFGRKPLGEASEADLVRLQDDADYTARDADLTAFAARGGKLITLAGLEDGNVPPLTVAEHYRRAVGTLGAETVTNFFVHSLVPGCRDAAGNPAALQGVIQDWVEKDVRPGALRTME